MPRLCTLISALILAAVSSHLDAASTTLRLRTVLFDPLKRPADLYAPITGESLQKLTRSLGRLSQPQSVTVIDGMLRFFDSPTIDPEKPLANLAAATRIPDTLKRAIVFILPAEKDDPLAYRMVVLDDDPRAFPKGETRVLNITRLDLAMKAGEHSVKLPPGKISPVPLVTKVNDLNRAQTEFYRQGDALNPWLLFSERPMQFSLNARNLIVIYGMPNLKEPRLQTLVDTELR